MSKLPAGFVLDAPTQGGLPPGFVIDAPQSQMAAAITDVPKEIGDAATSAATSINDNLNPFSAAAKSANQQEVQNPSFLGGFKDDINRLLGVGKGLASIPGLVASPVTGAARSLIGHPMVAAEHAIGSMIAPDIAAKDNPQQMYDTAKGDVDLAMMAARPQAATPKGMRTVPAPTPSGADLKSAATSGYDAAKNSGVEISPNSVQRYTSKVTSDLNADGLNEVLAPKTFGVLDKLGNPPQGSVVTVNDFRTMQRALGHAAKSPDPTERLAATRAIQVLNDHVENLPVGEATRGTPQDLADMVQTVKEANANYAAAKRAETVSGKLDRADLNAGSAHSGQNIDNATRQQIKTILTNPKLRRGFSPAELAQMEKLVRGTSIGNVTRGVGNLLGGGGGLGALAASGTGFAAAGPAGAAAPAAGFLLKKLGNALTAKQARILDEMIRARAPHSQSLPALNAPMPNPLLRAIFPNQIPQGLPLLLGTVPARADQQQR